MARSPGSHSGRPAATVPCMHSSAASPTDGTHVFFETYESLAGRRHRRATRTCTSATPAPPASSAPEPSAGNGVFDATFRAVSADGQRVFFRTAESLLAADTDAPRTSIPPTSRARSRWCLNTDPERPAGLQLHRGWRAQPGRASSSTTMRTGCCSERTCFGNLAPGSGYSVSQALPSGWSQVSADVRQRQPGVRHRSRGRRGGHLHVRRPARLPEAEDGARRCQVPLVPAYTQCACREQDPWSDPHVSPSCSQPVRFVVAAHRRHAGRERGGGEHGRDQRASGPWPGTGHSADEGEWGSRSTSATCACDHGPGRLCGRAPGHGHAADHGPAQRAVGQNEVGTVTDLPLKVTVLCGVTADDTTGSTCVGQHQRGCGASRHGVRVQAHRLGDGRCARLRRGPRRARRRRRTTPCS